MDRMLEIDVGRFDKGSLICLTLKSKMFESWSSCCVVGYLILTTMRSVVLYCSGCRPSVTAVRCFFLIQLDKELKVSSYILSKLMEYYILSV